MELNSASSSSALSPPTSASQSSIRPAAKPSTSHSPYYPPQPRQASEGSYGTLGSNPPSSGGQPAGSTGRSTAPAVPPPPPLTSSFTDAAETEAPAWTTPAAADTTPLTPPIVRNGMYPSTRRRVAPTTTAFGGSTRAATDGGAAAQTAPPMEYTASGEGGTGASSAHAFPSRAAAHSPASSFPGGQRMHPQQRQTQVYQESYARDAGQQQGRQHPTFLSRGGDGEGDAAYYEEGADRRFQQQQQQQQYAPRSPATASSGGGGSRGYTAYPPPSGDYAQPEADSAEADAASQAAYYQQYCQQYYQYQAYYQRQQQQPPTTAASSGNHHGNNGVASYGYAQASAAAAGGNESYPGSESGGMVAAGPADAATSPSVPPFGATYAQRGMSRGRSYYSDYGEGNQNNTIGNNNNSSTDTPAYSPHAGTSAGRGGMRYGAQSNAANDFFTRVTGSAGGVGEAEQQQQHHRTASRADSANGSTLASSTDALVGYAGGGGPHSTSSGGYPSPHQAQAGYSADYDAAAAQQYHNAYADQTMAGGYRDYYNAGGGYTYNSGYYANAQHQRQPPQQQPYQRDGGGARGTYGQSSYGSYGYAAPYQEPYRNYPSAGGSSSSARRGYQQPHQPQHQQQQYAEQDAYAGAEEMQQGNAYWQPKPPPPPPHQQGGGTPQYAEGVPVLYATSPAEEEEASAATRTQTTFAGAVPKAGAASAAAVGNTATTPVAGESKSAIRKRKKAAAAAAAAAAALVASSGATEEPPRVSSAPLTTAQKRAAAPPPLSKAAWKVPPPAAAERGAEGAAKPLQASSAADDAPSRSSAAHYETRSSTQDPLISLERTASAERRPPYARPPQYVAPTGVNSERASLINVGGASAAAALKEGDAGKGTSVVEAKDAPLRATTCRDVSSKRLAAVETMTTTPPTSNSSSGDSGNSSSGDLGRTSNGSGEAHGRSSSYVHGNSPGGTQRFLRHSPLTQCVGAPFHTYLNGAMVGQAAQLQTLPPSAASAAAAAAAAASGATGVTAMASSTASVSTSSSQVIPAFYAPVQRLLAREVQPHRTISTTNTAGPGETSGRHRGASQLSDGNNAAAEAEAEAEAEESGSGLAVETGVGGGIGHVEGDGDAGDDGSGEHGARGFPRQPPQRSATATGTLSNELLGAASEASALRPATSVGAATASSPSSSPRSAAGIHPHHMHLFAHHSAQQQHQQQRPDSARAAMLPQHLHAYRHCSPSLQPVALAATASTGSDPCVQSPGSAASLPPRSPAGVGASAESAGAGMAPVSPPLRARGAGMAVKQASFSNHATPTASAPHAHMTTAAVGSGAASTMHYAKQQQLYQQAPTHPSSPRTYAPAVGGAGYVDTVGAEAADGDANEEAGRAHDGIGRSGGSAYAAAGTPQHQQAQYGSSGSGRRSSLGAYRPSPSSPSMSVSAGANAGGSFASPPSSSSRPVPPAIGTLTPMAEQQLLPGAQSIGPHTSSSTSANVAGAAAYNTPSPRSGQQGSYGGGGGGSSAHANSPQRGRYSPRHPFAGAGNTGGANTAAAHPNNGFQAVQQQPAYIYEHHTGQEVLLEEFHAAMGFNAQSFGNIACLVDAFAPSVPIASDLEFPCDEEQCQLLQLPEVVGSGSGAEEAGLCSPLAAPGAGSSGSNGSAFCSRDGGPSLHLEDTALPSMLKPPPRPSEVDRGHYWDFSGPSYCEPVLTLKSIWQSFDSPFGCVVNLAEPIFPAPMRPAEDELVYTPLLSGFRIRFHPASPSYKRLAALREVRRQRRREEGRADGSDGGGGGSGRDGALAEADGVLTWSAADRPNNRNIIFEQVSELARCDESYAELLTATTADVDHQSWVALMWQPVFCGGHSAKHSCGTFLAFYLLRAPRHLFVPFASKSEGAAMNSSWSSPVFRGDRAALSFDLWSLQRHYHVARWVSSPPMTHVTTALSVAGEEDEDASSISASRGRLSWEDGAAGYASNAAESFSVSNHGEARARLRDVTSQSFAEAAAGTSAASYVRLPLVGLIPNRCRSEVWFKAIYDANAAVNAHPGANPNNGSSNGNASGGDPFFFHAPLFLIVTALQLMCWDAYNEWRHKSAPVLLNSAESRETAGGEAASVPGNADVGGGGSTSRRISNEPAELENPLTHLMEEEMSAAVQQRVKSGETERSHGDGQERVEEGERGGENRPNLTAAGSSAWVAYFAEGVEVMTDAARRYRQVREQANLDALPEDGGAALQPSAAAATPVARAGAESPALTSKAPASGDSEEKKFASVAAGVEEGAVVRSGATALVAGGTNSALCDTEARVIAGLLDYYQWAQYDSALSGLARLYCTT